MTPALPQRDSPAAPPPVPLPAWRRFAVPAPDPHGQPILSLIIDDMGVNRVQSVRAMALPAPLTLSWLPYARHLAEQVAEGTAHGHETMLHMPMEPLGRTNPGPNALRVALPPDVNLAYLREALDSIPNAVGLNQHEGSVASANQPLLDLVMAELAARQMLFIDSVVIPGQLPLKRARAAGLPSLPRDVFLDHEGTPEMIRFRLAQAEAMPRRNTMDVLEKALPALIQRGVTLWPISATVAARGLAHIVI
jgi:polysaccharide deacetylase 2 family uncharacterized protein YibQ